VRFLHPEYDQHLELSTDDVFLNPGYFDGGSRLETDLTPPDFPGGSHPIVSANMNAVTGKRMAEPHRRPSSPGAPPRSLALSAPPTKPDTGRHGLVRPDVAQTLAASHSAAA
jgi:IMP dehydrogenase